MGKKILSKLTVKDVFGTKQQILGAVSTQDAETGELIGKDEGAHLCNVYGVVTGAVGKESALGPYVLFTGAFRAEPVIGKHKGDQFVSGKMILPATAQDVLHGAFQTMEVGSQLEFAFKIGAKYDATAATLYVYTVESVLDVGESATMQALAGKLSGNSAPALPDALIVNDASKPPAPAPETHAASAPHAHGEADKPAGKRKAA